MTRYGPHSTALLCLPPPHAPVATPPHSPPPPTPPHSPPTTPPPPPPLVQLVHGTQTHTGFTKQWRALTTDAKGNDSIVEALYSINKRQVPHRVIISGFSLGAGLSELSAPYFASLWPTATILISNQVGFEGGRRGGGACRKGGDAGAGGQGGGQGASAAALSACLCALPHWRRGGPSQAPSSLRACWWPPWAARTSGLRGGQMEGRGGAPSAPIRCPLAHTLVSTAPPPPPPTLPTHTHTHAQPQVHLDPAQRDHAAAGPPRVQPERDNVGKPLVSERWAGEGR